MAKILIVIPGLDDSVRYSCKKGWFEVHAKIRVMAPPPPSLLAS